MVCYEYILEEPIWGCFLQSEDGQNYLEILVSKALQKIWRSTCMWRFTYWNQLMDLLGKRYSYYLTRDTAAPNISYVCEHYVNHVLVQHGLV